MSKNPFLLTKNDILDAFNSIVNSDELKAIENLQSNLSFLSSRNTTSALDALQGYGVTTRSPNWNVNNIEPSSTPNSSTSIKHFSNDLNLNSVEEEDEFLYGDSNSVPEEPLPVKEESILNTAGRHDSGWSDDEDPYGDPRPLSKLNSRLRKNLSESESQNKFQENVNFPNIKREESRAHSNIPSRDPRESAQKYPSYKLQSDDPILSSEIEKNNFPEISATSSGSKSKYHAAAEILKKRNAEKSNVVSNSSSEKLGVFPGSSKNSSELDKPLHSDLKTDKSADKKSVPRIINKKHIDNIRDYLSGPPLRKRSHPYEDYPTEKHPRYETSRTSSFSPSRRHSPHRSSLPIHKPKSSHASSESDHTRHASSYSRPRSPSFESEKRHHSRYSDSNRRYSPSPKRWSRGPDYKHRRRSRERSSDYNRFKDRSPRGRRTRSRSPGYYSSRNKTYDKKHRSKSPKKTDYYPNKKEKYSSGDSYCSLSLGSSSSSSSDSSDSSDEKRSSRKSPVKSSPRDNRKLGDEIAANLKASKDSHTNKPVSSFAADDISKKLSDIFNVKDKDGNSNLQLDSASINQLLSASLPNREQQLIMNFLEHQMQPQQQSIVVSNPSTFPSPSVSGINIASNMQMMSSPDPYAYPSVPAAPVQYMAPQMPNFPPMIPSAAFPAPVMTAPPPPAPAPAEYGPYLTVPPVPANDSQYVTNVTSTKSGKVSRPATLRTIPVSDNLHVSATPSSNITVVPTSNIPLQKSATTAKIQESKTSSSKLTKQVSENKTKNLKEKDEKNASGSASPKNLSNSVKNKFLIIEKFKKMKAERTIAQKKSKHAMEDLDEMRKMLEETFGRKPSPSDKMLYSKCRNQFNVALDAASQHNKEARKLDETLNSFKAKLPTALQAEVSKLKVEPITEEPSNEIIVACLDKGDHLCCDCCISFNDLKEMLKHIQSPEHKEQMEANIQEWKKDFVKESKEDQNNGEKKTVLKEVKGPEFLKPLSGFYCALCKEVFIEETDAEKHLKGHRHYTKYQRHIKEYPLYEKQRFDDRSLETDLGKDKDDKEETVNESIETVHKNESELKIEFACKAKRLKATEDSKEDHSDSSSEDENLNDVQKILSGKKIKDDSNTKSKTCENTVTKTVHKFVFIGKSPAYRKKIAEKDKPWYKRESILNKSEENSDSNSKDCDK